MELIRPRPGAAPEGAGGSLRPRRRARLLCDAAVVAQGDAAAEAARKLVILWDEAGEADVPPGAAK